MPPACIHGDGRTLCPACQAEYDYDPLAYLEYGEHPAGIARWRELQAEMDADTDLRGPTPAEADPDLPF